MYNRPEVADVPSEPTMDSAPHYANMVRSTILSHCIESRAQNSLVNSNVVDHKTVSSQYNETIKTNYSKIEKKNEQCNKKMYSLRIFSRILRKDGKIGHKSLIYASHETRVSTIGSVISHVL
jgi:hypothetical protein